jgi:hypothetical protein
MKINLITYIRKLLLYTKNIDLRNQNKERHLASATQGDSYSLINILTSGRFRSQKALDNKILNYTSKITISVFSLLVNAILR